MTYKKSGGFTLIEILVVISIMSVVFGIVITAAARAQKNARDAQKRSDLAKVQLALEQFYTDQGHYPVGIHMDVEEVLDSCMDFVTFYPDDVPIDTCRASASRKIFLPELPHSLEQQRADAQFGFGSPIGQATHYCYRARVSRAGGDCVFDDITPANTVCNYYELYARLETGPPLTASCIPGFGQGVNHAENYVVTPDTTGVTF